MPVMVVSCGYGLAIWNQVIQNEGSGQSPVLGQGAQGINFRTLSPASEEAMREFYIRTLFPL